MHTHVHIFHIHTVNRKSLCEFNTFVLKEFHESLTPRILRASIFNRFQLSTHACVLSRVMDNEMLSCVRGYHIYYTYLEFVRRRNALL